MLFPIGLILALILVLTLRWKPLVWMGIFCLAWTVLAFALDFFDVSELDKNMNGALLHFAMYGFFLALPLGLILLIGALVKRSTCRRKQGSQ